MFKDLVTGCRSYRRFYEDERIPTEELEDIIDTARVVACTANAQPLKYKIVNNEEDCSRIFPNIKWAAALKDWDGPEPGERPSAYILLLCDYSIARNKQWDEGIAAQTIMLAATEKGYGGCIIASCNRAAILSLFELDPSHYALSLVLALGKPKEEVRLTGIAEHGTTYYRDADGVHYVPKRALEDILI